MFIITLEREYARGPVEREVVEKLDALRPHLARGALMSARLQLERARVAAKRWPLSAFPHRGSMIKARSWPRSLVEALTGYVHWRAQDRVSLKERGADQSFGTRSRAIIRRAVPSSLFPGPRHRRGSDDGCACRSSLIIRLRHFPVLSSPLLFCTPAILPQAPPVELVTVLVDSDARRGACRF